LPAQSEDAAAQLVAPAFRSHKARSLRELAATMRPMDWLKAHLALNHLPVIGIPLLVLLLAIARCRKSVETTRFILWTLLVMAAAAIAIKFTGDFAAEQLQGKLAAAQTFVSNHEQAGDQATAGAFILLLLTLLALYLTRRGRILPKWLAVLVIIAGLVSSLLLANSAHTGGQIIHPELR
jgi:hypothetical protein